MTVTFIFPSFFSCMTRFRYLLIKKGCHKGTRGTIDLLYIDQQNLNESKKKREKCCHGVDWLPKKKKKKAYDMIPQWYLKMYKISDKVTKLITEAIKNGKRKNFNWGTNPKWYLPGRCTFTTCNSGNVTRSHTEICTGGYKFTESQEKIKHLMYMDDIKLVAKNVKEWETLIQTIRIYSRNTGIEFGIEKRAMLTIKSAKNR